MAKERSILKMIFTNLMNSLKPKRRTGDYVGHDTFGNKFYEIPADRSVGRRKSSRWFVPLKKENFDEEMSAEWESWLRGRREQAPTQEELEFNKGISDMKKKNAAELETQNPTPQPPPINEKLREFPALEEYERRPGEKDKS